MDSQRRANELALGLLDDEETNHFTTEDPGPITTEPPLPYDVNTYLMPFIVVIGLCISVIFFFMIIRCIRNLRKGNKYRLKKKYLKQIPITKYQKGVQFDTCAICLEEFLVGEKVRALPCSHLYHMKCIDPWLTRKRKVCPVCKGKVILPGMSEDSDSDMEAEGNEDGANERTPLIHNSSSPEASTSTRRIANYITAGPLSSDFRLRFDRSTQVNRSNLNSSILTSVEADITPITGAPEHSVNCAIEPEPSAIGESSTNAITSRSRDRPNGDSGNNSRHNIGNTNGVSRNSISGANTSTNVSTQPASPSNSSSSNSRSTVNRDIIV